MVNLEHYHFIGIGGIGMSGIALALVKKGFSVSGSDINNNNRMNELMNNGATIFNSQNKLNIELITEKFKEKKITIVISSAINNDNEELRYCIKKELNIKHRSEVLSIIMRSYETIAVAGTHGKTSTSTILATLLDLCTNNTSAIIGGVMPSYKSNSLIKDSKYLVAEVDESDGTITNYNPYLGIINNIDFDHCDYYSDLHELISSFKQFGLNCKQLLSNFDCKISQDNTNSHYKWSLKHINEIDFAMIPTKVNQQSTIAKYYEKGKFVETLNIPIPGMHNLSNVTAAISACRICNVGIEDIINNIQFLKLPLKRFECRGNINGRTIIDDYGHHPSEIKATIELARLFIKSKNQCHKRLVLIFQPHRFSRINKFLSEFAQELSKADYIVITDIYGAGETNTTNINSKKIVDKIYCLNQNVKLLNNNNDVKKEFFNFTNKGDLILNMGAGDCHKLWPTLKSY